MKCIRIVQHTESEAIERLRLDCYLQAPEFRLLQPECLKWGHEDDEGVVLAAWDGAVPVSTTRALMVLSATQAAELMGCSVDLPPSQFPALLVGRGATANSDGRRGLHSALRYHIIKSAIASNIRSLLGMVYRNAPRTNIMQEIGYTFLSPEKVWDPEVEIVEPVKVAHLGATLFPSACSKLEHKIRPIIDHYVWIGEPIDWSARFPSANGMPADRLKP